MTGSLQVRTSEKSTLDQFKEITKDRAKRSSIVRLMINNDGSNASETGKILDQLKGFDNLREVILSGPIGRNTLPELPEGLRVLSLKDVSDLEFITNLPSSLQRLAVVDSPNLTSLCDNFPDKFQDLTELVLSGCKTLPDEQLLNILGGKRSENLRDVDLSDCQQLTRLPNPFPSKVERLVLSRCTGLMQLPNKFGGALYRLDVDGCTSLDKLPTEWSPRIRHVNLSGCRRLNDIGTLESRIVDPKFQTLFLHGSGIRTPPAWAHGPNSETNVAIDTRDYFDDKKLSGAAEISRCKILLLGNGGAGKTELSHRIRKKPRARSDYSNTRVSTHGVQLHSLPSFEPRQGDKYHLQIWDFGGQDIYHNTHRVFATTGSVFLIVWDPNQDNQRLSKAYGDESESLNYPLRYWLDYVFGLYPGFCPEVAIICNDRSNKYPMADSDPLGNPELMKRLLLQVGTDYSARIKSNSESKIGFFVSNLACDGNSLPPDQQDRCKDSVKGQWKQIDDWIKNSVIRIKDTQGSSVPAYQELAYQMVVGVQEGDTTYDPPKTSKLVPEFAEDLKKHIHERLKDREEELRSHWKNGDFLTEQRAVRTLRFLTNIGCLYWDPKHTGSRAILDQTWAFEQVYKLLERESDSAIRTALCARSGRFDEPFLKEHFWEASGIDDPEDQQLILSFMVSIGVCLPLKKRWQYTIGEGQEYLSPEHLPRDDSQVSKLVNENFGEMTVSPTSIVDQESLHDGHWNAIMRAVAEAYGTDAQFYRDAILIQGVYQRDRHVGESSHTKASQDDIPWKILMTYTPVEYSHTESPQIKDEIKAGRIDEMHSASMTEEHLGEFYSLVQSLCPGGSGNVKQALEKLEREYASSGPEPTVFLSYGWDPEEGQTFYTAGVNFVESMLLEGLSRENVIRDKISRNDKEGITDFMQRAVRESNVGIVFLSDKYLTSWYCMWELDALFTEVEGKREDIWDRIQCIVHPSGNMDWLATLEKFKSVWEQRYIELNRKRILSKRIVEENLADENLRDLVNELKAASKNAEKVKEEVPTIITRLSNWESLPAAALRCIDIIRSRFLDLPGKGIKLKLNGQAEPYQVDEESGKELRPWISRRFRESGYSIKISE